MREKRGLGKGLSALLADLEIDEEINRPNTSRTQDVENIPIEMISPNSNQPRRQFPEAELQELADSILEKGIIQPLIVRNIGQNQYQIVAGERRWRAAQMAKVHVVPAIVRNYSDVETQEIAIIENIQRQELNVLDEANAYLSLIKTFGHTQEQLSKILGKSRSHIANLLRLNDLPIELQNLLRDGQLSMGHARALLSAKNPVELARKVVREGLNVREAERLARLSIETENKPQKLQTAKREKDADTRLLEQELSANLGMKVEITHKDGRGSVKIDYQNLENLDLLCKLLSSNQ